MDAEQEALPKYCFKIVKRINDIIKIINFQLILVITWGDDEKNINYSISFNHVTGDLWNV